MDDAKHWADCPVEACPNRLALPIDLVCPGDFAALASACRGKKRLGQPLADMIASSGRGSSYQCPLCRQWHNGGKPERAADLRTQMRATVRALRGDDRCGPEGLLNLIDAWCPTRVKRESWHHDLDQRDAYALPWS